MFLLSQIYKSEAREREPEERLVVSLFLIGDFGSCRTFKVKICKLKCKNGEPGTVGNARKRFAPANGGPRWVAKEARKNCLETRTILKCWRWLLLKAIYSAIDLFPGCLKLSISQRAMPGFDNHPRTSLVRSKFPNFFKTSSECRMEVTMSG